MLLQWQARPTGRRCCRWISSTTSGRKLFQKAEIGRALDEVDPGFGGTARLLFSRHHLSHAASAFYPSPFDEADGSYRLNRDHFDFATGLAMTSRRFHALISAFADRTGCPVPVDTSFNVRGEPVVCTPEDAFTCFMDCGLDLLAKSDQDPARVVPRTLAPD